MTFLLVLHTILCIGLVSVILIQPGKSDMGIGFGSASQGIFSSKSAANFLTRATSIAATLFLFTSFLITKARVSETSKSVIDSTPAIEKKAAPAATPEKKDEKAEDTKEKK